ncbi:MAG: hypothetical protein IPJ65_24225 [Archangiaceae bacterium]|nr:hypothetical protein [Archangiaceae bacterium]
MMLASFAVAVVLSQAEPVTPPEEAISEHVAVNIKRSLSGATAGATVTVMHFDGKTAALHVEEPVMGTVPENLDVQARAFSKRDLEPGTRLLVFFRGQTPTGQYERISDDDKIREYTKELYLSWTRFEHSKLPKARAASPAPAAAAKPAAPPAARATSSVAVDAAPKS